MLLIDPENISDIYYSVILHMSTKKKQPPKDTAIEEIDLSAFDIDTIDTPPSAPIISVSTILEPKRVLSQRERDTLDDHAVSPDE